MQHSGGLTNVTRIRQRSARTAPGKEGKPFEKLDILLGLEQRTVHPRQCVRRVGAQILGRSSVIAALTATIRSGVATYSALPENFIAFSTLCPCLLTLHQQRANVNQNRDVVRDTGSESL